VEYTESNFAEAEVVKYIVFIHR